jgi:hypothetical protein
MNPVPVLSDRVRDRALAVVAWVGVPGAAFFFSEHGVVLRAGPSDVDAAELARRSAMTMHEMTTWSFPYEGSCAYATIVAPGWTLCVLSTMGASAGPVLERLERGAHVLALALRASGAIPDDGAPPTGAPAHAFADRIRR